MNTYRVTDSEGHTRNMQARDIRMLLTLIHSVRPLDKEPVKIELVKE